jgi:recA bacterial DNA recombination protein
MSSAVVSTSAAQGRPFVFDEHAEAEEYCHPERSGKCAKRIFRGVEEPALSLSKGSLPLADARLAQVTSATQLAIRPEPEMVSSGIPAIDALTGGLPRGCLTEIYGPASSGRTTLLLAALAAATRRGEFCAVVDASDSLDPQSAVAAGVELDRLLWVRCNDDPPKSRAEKVSPTSRASLAREACPEHAEWVGAFSQAAFDFDRTSTRDSQRRSLA